MTTLTTVQKNNDGILGTIYLGGESGLEELLQSIMNNQLLTPNMITLTTVQKNNDGILSTTYLGGESELEELLQSATKLNTDALNISNPPGLINTFAVRNFRDNQSEIFANAFLNFIILDLQKHGYAESAGRIYDLRTTDDIEDGEKRLTLESVQGFHAFISEFNQLGEPILGVFSEGTLSAGWRVSDNKHLLIEFLDSERISFAMIRPDLSAQDKKSCFNGRATRNEVLKIISKMGVAEW